MNYYAVDNRYFFRTQFGRRAVVTFGMTIGLLGGIQAQEAAVSSLNPRSYMDLEQVSPGLTPEQPLRCHCFIRWDGLDGLAGHAA